MKKLRLLFKLLGVVALLIGLSSCKKDKDESCITCTFTYDDGDTDTEKICESDDDWEEYADSWEDFVTYVKLGDKQSDDIECD